MPPLVPATTALAVVALLTSGALTTAPASAAEGPVGGPLLSSPGVHVMAAPGKTLKPLPPITASSWVIADAKTGEVLAAKNAHLQRRPASTLKTLTAMALLPQLDPKDVYTPVFADVAAEGSKVGIVNGSRYTIDQLWYGLFLASGNDTAHALARANGGMAKTVSEMNVEAHRLQAYDTVAKTPSGLDRDGQHSSAYDLALISRAGLQRADFAKYCSTVAVKFPRAGKAAKRKTFMTYNHNPLVIGGYPGAIGVKTGYTDLAGRTFVGAATRGDRTLLITMMNYGGSTYRTAASLLDWGFKNAKHAEPVGTLVDPLPEAEHRAALAKANGEQSAPASSGSSGGGWWPFALLAAIALGATGWLLRGRLSLPEGDPLAAANKGFGKPKPSAGPRGRNGPNRY